ncbi:hypothetical protein [Collimonas humicola]|uniref:hypothetical protein n=1 Tax=Collimonas humicola TaxID=2825886 RepID=UPI001B8B131E|nr:hypothetical protein [Collimonas humicola]
MSKISDAREMLLPFENRIKSKNSTDDQWSNGIPEETGGGNYFLISVMGGPEIQLIGKPAEHSGAR